MGHITEAEEKKGKKEQDKGQIDIGKNKEKEGKKQYWERNWVIFTSTTYYFGWCIRRDNSCIKGTSFFKRGARSTQQKGERQYLTAFAGFWCLRQTESRVPVALNCISLFLFLSLRPSPLPYPLHSSGDIFSISFPLLHCYLPLQFSHTAIAVGDSCTAVALALTNHFAPLTAPPLIIKAALDPYHNGYRSCM